MDKSDLKQQISLRDDDSIEFLEITRVCSDLISTVVLHEVSEKVKNPLEIPELLEALCKRIGNVELLNSRLVSSFWEEESSRAYMKRNLWDDFEDMDRKGTGIKSWHSNPLRYTSDFDEEFKDLCRRLGQSENPSLVLKNVEVTPKLDRPTEIPGCSNLVQDFGDSVSRFKIVNPDFSMLKKYVGFNNSYCPNLEALEIQVLDPASSTDPLPGDLELLKQMQYPLKLKEIRFNSLNKIFCFQERFGLSLINNSLHLTSLYFRSDSSVVMKTLVKILKELPHVTTHLTKIRLKGDVLCLLNDLSEIKWSSKLKAVEFYDNFYTAGHLSADPGDRNLSRFLERVAPNIEKFLVDETSESHDFPNFKSPRNLPQMPKVKDLWLRNYVISLEDGPQFLKKFPSLKILWIGGLGQTHQFLERNSQAGVIHNNLEEIKFCFWRFGGDFGSKLMQVETPATIKLLHQVFPKLTKVRMEFPETGADASVEDVKFWMEQAFHEIGLMKNLKKLFISFGSDDYHEPVLNESDELLDLRYAFANLQKLPNLTNIGICRSTFKFRITELLIMELIEMPKLESLDVNGWSLGAEKDKEMEEIFAKRNITLEIYNYTNDDAGFGSDDDNEGNEEEGEPVNMMGD